MTRFIKTFGESLLIIVILLSLAVTGLGILIWLAPVLPSAITPAQQSLMDIADWMVKTSIGAILGFSGARLAARTSGQRS